MGLRLRRVAVVSCLGVPAAGAQSTLHFTLAPGPYAVGFRAVELWDHTRTLEVAREPGASAPAVASARPLQVSVWYPGSHPVAAHRMRFREYTYLTSLPGRLPAHGVAARVVAESLFAAAFVVDAARGRRELSAATWAVRDASPMPGSFPIVVYGASRDGPSYENSTLAGVSGELWVHRAGQSFMGCGRPDDGGLCGTRDAGA